MFPDLPLVDHAVDRRLVDTVFTRELDLRLLSCCEELPDADHVGYCELRQRMGITVFVRTALDVYRPKPAGTYLVRTEVRRS